MKAVERIVLDDIKMNLVAAMITLVLAASFSGHIDLPFKLSEVKESGDNPLYHYIMWGANQGYDPHPEFSTNAYLAANPDVKKKGLNPLSHYLHIGALEGRPLR